MHAQTLIKRLKVLFTMCGVPSCVHSDNASYFRSYESKQFLTGLGIAPSPSSIYHPTGNSQVERYIGVIWQTVKLSLKSHGLDIAKWELVLPEVLHSQRSLHTQRSLPEVLHSQRSQVLELHHMSCFSFSAENRAVVLHYRAGLLSRDLHCFVIFSVLIRMMTWCKKSN